MILAAIAPMVASVNLSSTLRHMLGSIDARVKTVCQTPQMASQDVLRHLLYPFLRLPRRGP